MKKIIVLIFLLLPSILYAAELTSEQKNQARSVVGNCCHLLSDFARSNAFHENESLIIGLFPNSTVSVYDDIITEKEGYVYISYYLSNITTIYKHSLTFTYENINTVKVESRETPLPPDKSSQKIYAKLEVEKTIEGAGFYKKKVKNVFMVSLADNKIYGILKPGSISPANNSNPANNANAGSNSVSGQTSTSLWYEGLEYYNAKQYENALARFKKAGEKGNVESMYYCGVMYFTNKGCNNERDANGKKLNRKQRDAKAYEWYKKAEKQGHEEAHRQIMLFYY